MAAQDFKSTSSQIRHLLHRFPLLRQHGDLNRSNPGITLVVLL